jgi:hypothetical protein
MKRSSGEWDKVGMLLERHAHLNQLRVGTVQVYLVVVAAVLALGGGTDALTKSNSFVVPLGICLIGVGLLVFMYDLRLRARTHAVASEVARSAPDHDSGSSTLKPKVFDEDLAFSMVLMIVNSTLVYIGIDHWLMEGGAAGILSLAVSAGFFLLQASIYCWYWPRLAPRLSAWPDGVVQASAPLEEKPDQEATSRTKDH